MQHERLSIVRVHEDYEGSTAHVAVVVALGDTEYVGRSVGDEDPAYRPRLVGEATLAAVQDAAGVPDLLRLRAVATSELENAQVALAQIEVGSTGESLVGSALVHQGDAVTATVRAVLDALNRRLSRLT